MFTAENMHKIKVLFALELCFCIKTIYYYAFCNTSTFNCYHHQKKKN